METDLLSGRHFDPSSGRERFGVVAERWLEARDLRPRTRDTYASQLTHILDEFETAELRKITPSAVRAWHSQLSKSGLHANTVAKVYRLFRTMLDTAVDDGLLRTNPVHIKGAALERSIERPMLSWDDIERIADAIHPRFRALVWVGATSGLRYGELTGLTRRHVDLEDRSLRVDQPLSFVKGHGPTPGPPKSAAAHRTIVIPSGVVADRPTRSMAPARPARAPRFGGGTLRSACSVRSRPQPETEETSKCWPGLRLTDGL